MAEVMVTGKDNLLYEKWIEQVVFVHTYVVVCYLSSEFYHQLKLITKKWMQCRMVKKYFDVKCLEFKLSTDIKILTCLYKFDFDYCTKFWYEEVRSAAAQSFQNNRKQTFIFSFHSWHFFKYTQHDYTYESNHSGIIAKEDFCTPPPPPPPSIRIN